MELARYLVEAVVLEGRSYREVAHGVSKSWWQSSSTATTSGPPDRPADDRLGWPSTRDKARPSGPSISIGAGVRVRRDRIDKNGKVSLRYRTRLHHIGVGHAHKGKRVIWLVRAWT